MLAAEKSMSVTPSRSSSTMSVRLKSSSTSLENGARAAALAQHRHVVGRPHALGEHLVAAIAPADDRAAHIRNEEDAGKADADQRAADDGAARGDDHHGRRHHVIAPAAHDGGARAFEED